MHVLNVFRYKGCMLTEDGVPIVGAERVGLHGFTFDVAVLAHIADDIAKVLLLHLREVFALYEFNELTKGGIHIQADDRTNEGCDIATVEFVTILIQIGALVIFFRT